LPTRPPPTGSDALRQAMNLDKKASAQALKFVLLRSLGEAFVSTDYSEARLAEILRAADRDS
jgi:3-dehydroquinate synthetase